MEIKTFADLNKDERASALLEDLKSLEEHEAMRMANQIGRMQDV